MFSALDLHPYQDLSQNERIGNVLVHLLIIYAKLLEHISLRCVGPEPHDPAYLVRRDEKHLYPVFSRPKKVGSNESLHRCLNTVSPVGFIQVPVNTADLGSEVDSSFEGVCPGFRHSDETVDPPGKR